ncbi:hypothetical protein N7931_02565 [Catenovulum sp. 2E275]|uniref:hypothetical protein n=1 Tax=Catenovulum sp. 2E275 TaxID=2980497 RepID=UPI0021D1923E|nr:hypothetical protein [Catenovulum sp. 2E275]MCU4674504.1 hypothetical protein [Catenovulum sp. 2E275]
MKKVLVHTFVLVSFVFSCVSISMPSDAFKTKEKQEQVKPEKKSAVILDTLTPNMLHNELPMIWSYSDLY